MVDNVFYLCYSIPRNGKGGAVMRKYLLLEKMDKKKMSASDLSTKTGISLSSFYRKMSGDGSFNLLEVSRICDALEIRDPKDKAEIFLS